MTPEADRYLDALLGNGAARANYLMHWSAERRYLFVETPKAACTTIKRVLQTDARGGRPPEGDIHDRAASPLPRPSDAFARFRALCADGGAFRFCFVRNPFTRILSCYLDKFVANDWERRRLAPQLGLDPAAPPGFADFLEAVRAQDPTRRDIHWASQSFLLRPERFGYAFIGRFELFEPQFAQVCRHLGIAYAPGPVDRAHATGADAAVGAHFGAAETALVQEIYAEDFRAFGYGWSPQVV